MKNEKALLLLNDTTDWYHFGCTATSIALKEYILKLGYKLTAIPITSTYEIRSVPDTIEGFLDEDKFKFFTKNNHKLVRNLTKHEVLIINGEGTIHGLRQAPLSLLYVAYATKRFLGKHVEILNHSVYPQDGMVLDNPDITSIYRLVYQTIDSASIREPLSLSLMKQIGVEAIQSFDCMPLYIKDHYVTSGIKDEKILLIAGSAAWLHLNIPAVDEGNIEEFEQGLAGFISYVDEMADRGFRVKFLYGAKNYLAKDDREFIAFVGPRLRTKWTVVRASSLNNWLGHIERATLLVSGRFHHTIAAACLGTHFIALNSNTPKIEGLVKIFGKYGIINYNDPNITNKLLLATDALLMEKAWSDLDMLYKMAKQNFKILEKHFY